MANPDLTEEVGKAVDAILGVKRGKQGGDLEVAGKSNETAGVISRGETGGKGGGANFQERSQKLWAARAVMAKNREQGLSLSFLPQELGADSSIISLDKWKEGTEKLKNTLVGFVFGAKPPLGKVRGFARTKWGGEDVVKVAMLNDGIFLLKFASEEKKMGVLLGGPWTFDNRPFIVQEWSENEDYKCGSISTLPVWIRLPGIKAHLCTQAILSQLCSRLGKPICTDGVTAEGSSFCFARDCVEISADRDFIEEIKFEDPFGNKLKQRVVYEWKPPRCVNCLNFGHRQEICPEVNLETLINELKDHEEQENRMIVRRVTLALEEEKRQEILEVEDSCCSKSQPNLAFAQDNELESVTKVSETQEVTKNSDSIEEEVSDECTLGVQFKQYLSKSAAKKAKQKERKASLEKSKQNVKGEKQGKGDQRSYSVKEKEKHRERNGKEVKNKHTRFNF